MSNAPHPDQQWRKSSYSGTGNNCIEVTVQCSGQVVVRDSKDPDGLRLRFTAQAWKAFNSRAKWHRYWML